MEGAKYHALTRSLTTRINALAAAAAAAAAAVKSDSKRVKAD
jgi:hypothetical protein